MSYASRVRKAANFGLEVYYEGAWHPLANASLHRGTSAPSFAESKDDDFWLTPSGELHRLQFDHWEELPAERYSERAYVLDEAKRLITQDRNAQYGPPTADFVRTAKILDAMGYCKRDRDLTGHDVALIMMALKLSRLSWNPDKEDSWTDAAGYAACGWENVVEQARTTTQSG